MFSEIIDFAAYCPAEAEAETSPEPLGERADETIATSPSAATPVDKLVLDLGSMR